MTHGEGTWGLYQWFEEHGTDLIHPDDLNELRSLGPNGKIFHLLSNDGDFLTLQSGDRQFRVRPSLFKPVSPPAFGFGQLVSFKKGGKPVIGKIVGIAWHFERSEPFFLLELGGKRLSKRYWTEELEPAVAND